MTKNVRVLKFTIDGHEYMFMNGTGTDLWETPTVQVSHLFTAQGDVVVEGAETGKTSFIALDANFNGAKVTFLSSKKMPSMCMLPLDELTQVLRQGRESKEQYSITYDDYINIIRHAYINNILVG